MSDSLVYLLLSLKGLRMLYIRIYLAVFILSLIFISCAWAFGDEMEGIGAGAHSIAIQKEERAKLASGELFDSERAAPSKGNALILTSFTKASLFLEVTFSYLTKSGIPGRNPSTIHELARGKPFRASVEDTPEGLMLWSVGIQITLPAQHEPLDEKIALALSPRKTKSSQCSWGSSGSLWSDEMAVQLPEGSWKLEGEHITDSHTEMVTRKTLFEPIFAEKLTSKTGKTVCMHLSSHFIPHTKNQCVFLYLSRDKIDD